MQKVKLNLIPQGVPPVVYASQYDVGRQFEFEIYEGDVEYEIPSGAVVTFQGTKPDNHSFAYSTADEKSVISVSGSAVTVTSTEQMTAISHKSMCEIIIRNGKVILGTLNVLLDVEKGAIPEDANASASDLSAYESMASQVQGAHQEFKETREHVDKALDDVREYVDKALDDVLKAKTDIEQKMAQFNESLSQTHKVTLKADKWQGTEAPFSYKLGDFDDVIVNMILDAETITEDQIVAAQDAYIIGGIGSTIYAYEEKPTVDIPVVIGYASFTRKETS